MRLISHHDDGDQRAAAEDYNGRSLRMTFQISRKLKKTTEKRSSKSFFSEIGRYPTIIMPRMKIFSLIRPNGFALIQTNGSHYFSSLRASVLEISFNLSWSRGGVRHATDWRIFCVVAQVLTRVFPCLRKDSALFCVGDINEIRCVKQTAFNFSR